MTAEGGGSNGKESVRHQAPGHDVEAEVQL